jgi:peroxiredoxin family protein
MTRESARTPIEHLAIICSKGTLDMAYPGLILANAARMSGIDATLFFTFWGLDIITKRTIDHLHVPTVGNPRCTFQQWWAGCRAWNTWRR